MISEKDLRIGNYVFFEDEMLVFEFESGWNFEYIKPIPLTEEQLLKFGFEKQGSIYRIKNSRFVEIIVHDKGIDVCNHSVCLNHIKHVHQLQNLYFALTGKELTIKI